MQRISLDQILANKKSEEIQVEHSILSVGQRGAAKYSLFTPLHYEKNYGYPLLVWLHGPGDNERQLQRVMPQISLRNFAGVAPKSADSWPQTPAGISTAEQHVVECIEAARDRMHIREDRIFVGGYASGGTMALRLALREPERFAGAMSIGGPFPQGHHPLQRLDAVRGLPLLICQGRTAERYTIDTTCEELRLFHAAGMSVTLRQYPTGDELTPGMLADLNLWMMERITGQDHFSQRDDRSTDESPN